MLDLMKMNIEGKDAVKIPTTGGEIIKPLQF
jgi:hypothetical protein